MVLDVLYEMSGLTINVDKTKMVAIKAIQPKTLLHIYIRRATQCKWYEVSNILVLMSHRAICGMYVLSLDFKRVGIVIICLESMQPK
mgnify:FL=1